MWRDDGSTKEFLPGPRRLYYRDITRIEGTILADKVKPRTKVVLMAVIDSQVFEHPIYYCLVSCGAFS